jgi:hypothetical protein
VRLVKRLTCRGRVGVQLGGQEVEGCVWLERSRLQSKLCVLRLLCMLQ